MCVEIRFSASPFPQKYHRILFISKEIETLKPAHDRPLVWLFVNKIEFNL